MSVLAAPADVIERGPVAVMLRTCRDELVEIQRLWPEFERLVGLRGRKMYATVDVAAGTYTTCTPLRPKDDPASLSLSVGELPGGRFRRGRLRGESPSVYGLISVGVDELVAAGPVDPGRPVVEFYKRHDEIELWALCRHEASPRAERDRCRSGAPSDPEARRWVAAAYIPFSAVARLAA